MWYSLPWAFDEFFHEYMPRRWITKIQVFERPSQKMMTIAQSSLRTLDASGENLASSICSLPYVVLSDFIETFHLSFYNRPIHIRLSALRHITLLNSINCLNVCSSFPATVCSVDIHILCHYSNYMLPDWPAVLYSLSTLSKLNSLRIIMYDLPKTVCNKNCPIIAQTAVMVTDFGFYFRSRWGPTRYQMETVFKDHTKFIKQLCHSILLLSLEKQPYYSIEDDGCGLNMWF
jgi:hypothetical protein